MTDHSERDPLRMIVDAWLVGGDITGRLDYNELLDALDAARDTARQPAETNPREREHREETAEGWSWWRCIPVANATRQPAEVREVMDWLMHPDRSYTPHELAMEAHRRLSEIVAARQPAEAPAVDGRLREAADDVRYADGNGTSDYWRGFNDGIDKLAAALAADTGEER